MDEKSFREKFANETSKLNQFGSFVCEQLQNAILSNGHDLDKFLKVPITPRVKDIESLLGKAFYRNKNYNDPYNDITDKVALRAIVLTLDDVSIVCNLIKNNDIWSCSLDKDYEKEREENPHVFDYQSMHFVVSLNKDVIVNDILINKGTTCEIQVRTLMQHAYSELSHSVLYKPKNKIGKDTTRKLTRSVALIETVDDYFLSAFESIQDETSNVEVFYRKLHKLYIDLFDQCVGRDDQTNLFLLSSFEDCISDLDFEKISEYFKRDENKFVVESIKIKSKALFLYSQPVILVLYYLVKCKLKLSDFIEQWPLDETMIKPIFTDFGDSIDRYY